MIPTGKEHAEQVHQRADQELRRAPQAPAVREQAARVHQRADQELRRAERLAALLRRSGIDPEQE